ncbi:alcohol dehydrogenase [Lachnellula subtilissima]|uniref:Alcohol dehydrogenase n=1 Tax=Lachnellula subtilissima TaxID=602034 RepID=A0A8H8RLL6_9HELO|nr:alcohol dehydrogenase [Lachnellula subtilissima]
MSPVTVDGENPIPGGNSQEPAIPITCKAGVVSNNGPNYKLTIEDIQVPTPGPNELLIRLNTTGICYSDIHYMLEDLALPRMRDYRVRSPGHEGAGVVVALGANITNWKIGDRAGIKPTWDTCGKCDLCWGDMECHCKEVIPTGLKVPGRFSNPSEGIKALTFGGTYQQYILSPARYTSPIPDAVDDFSAGPIMCSGSTMYRSVGSPSFFQGRAGRTNLLQLKVSALQPGDFAVFTGAGGGVGHMGIQLAKAMGLRVIGIDAGAEKRALCLALGCEAFIDFSSSVSVIDEVFALTNGVGAHGVFVTATSSKAYADAPKMCRVGGKIMCVGMPPTGTAFVGGEPMEMILKGLSVVGT